MNKLTVALALVLLHILVELVASDPSSDWNLFKKTHRKTYKNTTEEVKRQKHFENSKKEVDLHNSKFAKGQVKYKKALNKFSDRSTGEKKQILGRKFSLTKPHPIHNPNPKQDTSFLRPKRSCNEEVPDNFSWIDSGVVTSVKDQGSCGSCWAFASVGSLEGRIGQKLGYTIDISAQQLVDCDTENGGCNGGYYFGAMRYWNKTGFQDTNSYPYIVPLNCGCHTDPNKIYRQFTVYPECQYFYSIGDETRMKEALYNGWPVAISIQVVDSFFSYSSGIYTDDTCSNDFYDLNHSVLLVGYGTENGQDYWLVKNSWGTSWGEGGYVKIARNANNMCGVVSDPCFIDADFAY